MLQLLKNINVDWLAYRRTFIIISVIIMLGGLGSSVVRQVVPGGTEAFNLGVDFQGGTVITAKFKNRPSAEEIRAKLSQAGVNEAIIQPVTDKTDEVLIKLPLVGQSTAETEEERQQQNQAQVDAGRSLVDKALKTFGDDVGPTIVGTDAVGAVAGSALRNQAIAVTLLALVGILMYIAFRFEWTYGAAAVIAVFHDVLVTLAFFSIFQWEISLTVIAALLTLVGFSVNDTIVIFDRIRENLRLHRRDSLYKITNDAVNQTLSRTFITSGLVFLSVLAMVFFGGEVLRGFSLALTIGIIFGTYSTIGIASPIMVWWQQRLEPARSSGTPARNSGGGGTTASGGRTRSAAQGTKARAATR